MNISGLIECESFSKISGIFESDSLIQAGDIRSYSSYESSDITSDGNTVMIQSSLAAALDVDDGDYLSISIPQVENNAVSLSKAGAYKVKQIETGDHSISNSSEIILDLDSFNKLSNERGAEHNLILWLEDPFDVQSVSKEIEMILASYQYEITDWMEPWMEILIICFMMTHTQKCCLLTVAVLIPNFLDILQIIKERRVIIPW